MSNKGNGMNLLLKQIVVKENNVTYSFVTNRRLILLIYNKLSKGLIPRLFFSVSNIQS